MGLTDSYAYFLPIHSLYPIVSIKLCHNYQIIHLPIFPYAVLYFIIINRSASACKRFRTVDTRLSQAENKKRSAKRTFSEIGGANKS